MSSENKRRMKRYNEIIRQQCRCCQNFKPKSARQCEIYRNLLTNMRPEIVEQEAKFLTYEYGEGLCKYWRYDKKVDDLYGKR